MCRSRRACSTCGPASRRAGCRPGREHLGRGGGRGAAGGRPGRRGALAWSIELPAAGAAPGTQGRRGQPRSAVREIRASARLSMPAPRTRRSPGSSASCCAAAPILDPGTLDGEARLEQDGRGARGREGPRARPRGRLARRAGRAGLPGGGLRRAHDVQLDTDATIRPREGSLVADRLLVVAGAVDGAGRLRVEGGLQDPRVDLRSRSRGSSSHGCWRRPASTSPPRISARRRSPAHVSGAPTRAVAVGRDQRLDFTPPARVPALAGRLAGPFVPTAPRRNGGRRDPGLARVAGLRPARRRAAPLRAGAPDRRGLGLLRPPRHRPLRAAGGAGHQPVARGFVRGASTITQQLAKNLFLSRAKTARAQARGGGARPPARRRRSASSASSRST